MNSITTHILDTSLGKPAANVPIELEILRSDGQWKQLGNGQTDNDGRLRTLIPTGHVLESGTYRIRFDTKTYFQLTEQTGFYPYVEIVFEVRDASQHYHVPLLLNPYGYSTYRGS